MTQEVKSTRVEDQDQAGVVGAGGKYLTFALGEERYGLEILKVQEIIGVSKVTTVPRSPDYLKGVINLRGKIIPVIDLRLKLGMPEREYDEKTCFIVSNVTLNNAGVSVGVVVDTVLEVVNFTDAEIQPVPDYGKEVDTSFMRGLGKMQDKVALLLDIEKCLVDDVKVLGDITASTDASGIAEAKAESK